MLEDSKNYRVFETWHRLRRGTRLSLLVFMTVLSCVVSISWIAVDEIQKVRREGISRSSLDHAQALAMNGRAHFSEFTGAREVISLSAENIDAFKKYKLPRWPSKGESFVGEMGRQLTVFGRSSAGQVWYFPLASVPSPWRSSEHVVYWFTAQGSFLGSNSELITASDYSKRLLAQFYEISQGLSGGDFFRPTGGMIFGAFYEIPKTNVVIAVEAKATSDVFLLKNILLFSFILVVFASALSYWMGRMNERSYIRPLRHYMFVLQQIISGAFERQERTKVDYEFADLHTLIQRLGLENLAREKRFEKMRDGFERLLTGSREMTLVQDRSTVLSIGSSVLQGALPLTKECNVWVYLIESHLPNASEGLSPTSVQFLSAQLLARGVNQFANLVVGDCPHAKDPLEMLRRETAFLDPETRLLFVPVLFEEKAVGFFVVDGFMLDKIPPFEKVFLDAISGNVGIALRNVRVIEETRHSARMEGELLATETVQRSLISRDFQMDRVVLSAFFSPAERAGGDWFHYHFSEHDENLYLFVGDVTGHGIPSAMMTAVAFGAVSSAEKLVLTPQHAFGDVETKLNLMAEIVNSTILEAGQEKFFMTMLFMALHVPSGTLILLNAGHPAPIVVNSAAQTSHVLAGGGSPLGSQSQGRYEVLKHKLELGDGVFAYSDGLIENEGPSRARLSKRRLSRILASSTDPEQTLTAVVTEGRKIWENNGQADDITSVWLFLRNVG